MVSPWCSLLITQRCHQQGKGKGALPDQPVAPSFTEGKKKGGKRENDSQDRLPQVDHPILDIQWLAQSLLLVSVQGTSFATHLLPDSHH